MNRRLVVPVRNQVGHSMYTGNVLQKRNTLIHWFLFSCFTESVIRKSMYHLLFHAMRLPEISCSFGGELKRRSKNAVKWYTLTPSHFVYRIRKLCTVPVWQKILSGFFMKMVSALNLTNAETKSETVEFSKCEPFNLEFL